MSQNLLHFAAALNQDSNAKPREGEEMIEVSLPARSAGALYEKARSAIDYQEEHLLRRNAILRIIRRFVGSDTTIADMVRQLIEELIWAKHLPNGQVPVAIVDALIPIFDKYEPLLREIDEIDEHDRDDLFSWVLDVLSTEVEYVITPPYADEALVSFMYQEMKGRVDWDPALKVTDEQKDLFTYIAVHKALLKSNTATLRFRVLTLYYPEWPGGAPASLVKDVTSNLERVAKTVDDVIAHPIVAKLMQQMRRRTGVFHILRTMAEENPEQIPELVNHPEKMDREVQKVLKKRTRNFRKRLRRKVLRSILFLLVTKTFFAMLVEVPYDILLLGERHYVPVVINIIFPPLLLGLLALTVTIPEKRNAADYVDAVRAILVGAKHDLLTPRMKRSNFTGFSPFFSLLYAITYIVVYGGIAFLLSLAHFSWVSIVLFLSFLSLVAFFGIRIRYSVRDILLSDKRRGLVGTLFDFFMIPVVRLGRWLSENVSKINIFIYFFDFILEAPIKIAIRFFEAWSDYIREKREEL
jgi:hypothetical protein